MTLDWKENGRQAVERLRRMIRFDTTNPPGNEKSLVEELALELQKEGLAPQILESGPGRANLAVRLQGDASERPLIFLSHLDVVPAEPDKWTHPPFAAELDHGFVWGRGAIDSKLTGAVQLQVLLMCRRMGLPLRRDLVVVAAADEEYGGKFGVQWLVEHHPGLFDAEYGINEAGGFALLVDNRPLYTCQVGEKGAANLDLVARGRPGHSSVPHQDNAIFHLARALEKLSQHRMPHRVPGSVRAFFEAAAQAMGRTQVAQDLRAVLHPQECAAALARLPVNPATRLMFAAMVRNTCAPTILEAGVKRNVIPSQATAQLSGRPLPGVRREEFVAEVQEIAGDGVEYRMGDFRPGVEFEHRTPLFKSIAASLRRFDPEGVLVPYMQTGGTDARFLVGRGLTMYGFIPMRHEPGLDFFDLCHGHDERVSVANVEFAVQVLFDVVCRLNGVEPEI